MEVRKDGKNPSTGARSIKCSAVQKNPGNPKNQMNPGEKNPGNHLNPKNPGLILAHSLIK
jgi:hypothetical protein